MRKINLKIRAKASKPKAAMLAVPEYVEALTHYNMVQTAMDKLAQLARAEIANQEEEISAGQTWRSKKQYATNFLGALPGVSAHKAIEVLASAPPDAPHKLAHVLLVAMTDGNKALDAAMQSRPKQFAKFARQQLVLPTLRSLKETGDAFQQLADSVELGADYGLKRKGAANLSKPANAIVAEKLLRVRQLRKWAIAANPATLAPWVKKLARTKFPPLTREKASLDFWWKNGILPLLRNETIQLPEKYSRLGNASINKPWKVKPALRAKNLFETDCQKSLKNLASPVTDNSRNRS